MSHQGEDLPLAPPAPSFDMSSPLQSKDKKKKTFGAIQKIEPKRLESDEQRVLMWKRRKGRTNDSPIYLFEKAGLG